MWAVVWFHYWQVADRPDKVWVYNLAVDPTERNNLANGTQWSEVR